MTEKRDLYVQKLKAKLDEWNAKIDQMTAKADQAEAEAKRDYRRHLENLKEKRQLLESKIKVVQNAGEGSWEDLKQGLEKAWDGFKESFARAKSEFEQGYRKGRRDE